MADIATFDHPEGQRDNEGRFEPFYVPRPLMPQVHHRDYPELLAYLHERMVEVSRVELPCIDLQFHQRVGSIANVHNPDKPVLISLDRYVLDGNHREEWHREHHEPVSCIMIHLPFGDAIEVLLAFPKTYTIPAEEN
jgi:hypothetical protein